jgi:uncharacterized protein
MITEFTPLASLAGGAMIGLSAIALMALNGRIAGVSGIVSKLVAGGTDRSPYLESALFVLGLLSAAPLYFWSTGQFPTQSISDSWPLLVTGGLLVGFGSVFGGGCTSGHGVCGISRLSTRSIVATVTFMITAFITVYLIKHL